MANIKDIVTACVKKRGLKIGENESKYTGFLERQIEKHSYGINQTKYFNFLRDKLSLFSYLTGESTIIAGYKGHTTERRIGWYSPKDHRQDGSIVKDWELKPQNERKKDLYLLRFAEMGLSGIHKAQTRTDDVLATLCNGFANYKPKYDIPNSTWVKAIDDLGEDVAVSTYYGETIDSKTVSRCESPNPLTSNRGGSRKKKRARYGKDRRKASCDEMNEKAPRISKPKKAVPNPKDSKEPSLSKPITSSMRVGGLYDPIV